MTLTRVFMPALNLLGGSRQRSAVSGSSSSRAAMAYTPTPNNTSGVSSSTISSSSVGASVSGVVPQNIGSNNSTQTQRCSPIVPSPILPKAPTRIIFGIQGLRKSLEIEQIMVSNQMNDQTFFPELRNRYKKHRLSLLRWLSPFQFRHCDFVRVRLSFYTFWTPKSSKLTSLLSSEKLASIEFSSRARVFPKKRHLPMTTSTTQNLHRERYR
jgi:hypothetical protein